MKLFIVLVILASISSIYTLEIDPEEFLEEDSEDSKEEPTVERKSNFYNRLASLLPPHSRECLKEALADLVQAVKRAIQQSSMNVHDSYKPCRPNRGCSKGRDSFRYTNPMARTDYRFKKQMIYPWGPQPRVLLDHFRRGIQSEESVVIPPFGRPERKGSFIPSAALASLAGGGL